MEKICKQQDYTFRYTYTYNCADGNREINGGKQDHKDHETINHGNMGVIKPYLKPQAETL